MWFNPQSARPHHVAQPLEVEPAHARLAAPQVTAIGVFGVPAHLFGGECPAKAHHHVERAPCAPLLGVALSAIGELGEVGQRVALPGAAALARLAHKAGAHVSQVEQRHGHGQQRVGPILAQSAHPRQRLVQGITGHDDVVANPLPRPFPFFQGAHQSMASSVQYARPALLAGQRLGLTPVHTLVRPAAGSGRFGALSVWACVYCWHVPRR
ncbi:hypothetical protein AO826_21600 [Xanthomonas phaseoli pv. manihotis]|nr:hypothetical protein AO826_21600 [Xanthomonas phaseoli pv. manihotis]